MILVVGMGRSGIAAARLLKSRGLPVFVTDSDDAGSAPVLDALEIPYEIGGHSLSRFLESEEIVVSPGVPLEIEPLERARAKGIPIVGELEVAFRYLRGKVVAITGSNGKTTTTSLVGNVLAASGREVQVGGNIGRPMAGLVDASTDDGFNVVEVSSFQLDAIHTFRPHVGVLLNITPDHLDRYRCFEDYRMSKFRLFLNQQSGDFSVLNADDSQVCPAPVTLSSRCFLFSKTRSVEDGAFRSGDDLWVLGQRVMPVGEIPLRGRHNIDNVLAALLTAWILKIPLGAAAASIREFHGVEHRLEHVATIAGIEFVNDSKATNVDSAIKAVESFDGNIILILGGTDKGASYTPLVDVMRGRVRHVLLVGAARDLIAAALGDEFERTVVRSLDEAVSVSLDLGSPGDVVLLAPACASFDMFSNYEHRGRAFKAAVAQRRAG